MTTNIMQLMQYRAANSTQTWGHRFVYNVHTRKITLFIQSLSLSQVSFSGCLIENLDNLAAHHYIYAPGWNKTYSNAINTMKTSGGFKRLDFVAFTYHHALTTLIDR